MLLERVVLSQLSVISSASTRLSLVSADVKLEAYFVAAEDETCE